MYLDICNQLISWYEHIAVTNQGTLLDYKI